MAERHKPRQNFLILRTTNKNNIMNEVEKTIAFDKEFTKGKNRMQVAQEAVKWCKEHNFLKEPIQKAAEGQLPRMEMEKLLTRATAIYIRSMYLESLKQQQPPQDNK
jgi:energy-coupling factor transporter ATP-binding protein EcfA2